MNWNDCSVVVTGGTFFIVHALHYDRAARVIYPLPDYPPQMNLTVLHTAYVIS